MARAAGALRGDRGGASFRKHSIVPAKTHRGLLADSNLNTQLSTLPVIYRQHQIFDFDLDWSEAPAAQFQYELPVRQIGFGKSQIEPEQSHLATGWETSSASGLLCWQPSGLNRLHGLVNPEPFLQASFNTCAAHFGVTLPFPTITGLDARLAQKRSARNFAAPATALSLPLHDLLDSAAASPPPSSATRTSSF